MKGRWLCARTGRGIMIRNGRSRKEWSYRYGLWAEYAAALWLLLRGYRIVARRYKTPVGEIDLIVRKGRLLAFIEVKARSDMTAALHAVTPAMRKRIVRAAQYFLVSQGMADDLEVRFDLIAVSLPFYCRHLDNAWEASFGGR